MPPLMPKTIKLALALAACGSHASSPSSHGSAAVQVWVETADDASNLERSVTIPIETGLMGLPNVVDVHSLSETGRAIVTVELGNGDVLAAGQEILAPLQNVELPRGVTAELGPFTSERGAIVRYTLHSDVLPLVQVRALQDWTIVRKLRTIPGVADVSTCGGAPEEIHILLDPAHATAVTVSPRDVE